MTGQAQILTRPAAMYSTHIFVCFVVIGGALTSPHDDLKLEKIFRTPKDFSKKNFEHFEILERNNFDHASLPSASKVDEGHNAFDHPQKSVANAQVMLRFGGDNLHNCRAPLSISPRFQIEKRCGPCESTVPPCPKSINVVAAPTIYPYSDYRYPYPGYLPTSQYPYSYPPTPYSFPGYYYGMRPFPGYPSNPYVINGQLFPADGVEIVDKTTSCEKIDSCEKVDSCEKIAPCDDSCEPKGTFLDCRKPLKPPSCDTASILDAKILSDEKIQSVSIPDIQNTQKVYTKDNLYVAHQEPEIVEEIVEPAPEPVVKIDKIDRSCIDPNPCPHRVSYVEENIRESAQDICHEPKQNIETLLDQALVPLTCQNCHSAQKLLVSYPIADYGHRLLPIPEEELEVPSCACCERHGSCGCWNRVRNHSIPYGKRFSTDLDSLLEVVPAAPDCEDQHIPPFLYHGPCDLPPQIYPTIKGPYHASEPIDLCDEPYAPREIAVSSHDCLPLRHPRVLNQVVSVPHASTPSVINQVVNVPPLLYGGYNRFHDAYYSGALSRVDRCGHHALLDELPAPAEYYSEPVKSVVYKEPSVTNIINVKNPGGPVVDEISIVEPNLHKILPKYECLSREHIGSLDLPDLVPTNRYLCAKCHNLLPHRTVCNREYLPIERRGPWLRDLPYLPPLVRDAPLVNYESHRYCPRCTKYSGELNELNELNE